VANRNLARTRCLEALAHLAGQRQHHRLPRQVESLTTSSSLHVGDEIADAAADQEMRLRRVARHLEPAASAASARAVKSTQAVMSCSPTRAAASS
jgi:hypothetical protein